MRLKITLEYFTSPGEELILVLSDGKSIAMEYVAGGRWEASLEMPSKAAALEYSFELHRGGQCVRREWGHHSVPEPVVRQGSPTIEGAGASTCSATGALEIRDRWQDRPEDSPFWTKAFTDVIFKRKQTSPKRSGNVAFTVPCARIRKNETLAITGSGKMFGDWKKFVQLKPTDAPLWSVTLNVKEPFEYKFVILDAKTGTPKIWESGTNHLFTEVPANCDLLEIRDIVPEFETVPWRGAGTAIPVFSLRSETSFGVGEFKDLKKLVDWAALTGQGIIQLLPINDTTMTGTWTDSYPYNANSTFALHPQFIHLPDAGVKADKGYKVLQKELNALPVVDYERVNKEKNRLLKEAFEAGGQEVMSGAAYKKFYSANKDWLVPYAAFCALRDINGTPEFGKWKSLSEYSETKVKSFCRRHKSDTDFYCYVQFCLDAQLKEVVEYAHSKGVAIKGVWTPGNSRICSTLTLRPGHRLTLSLPMARTGVFRPTTGKRWPRMATPGGKQGSER